MTATTTAAPIAIAPPSRRQTWKLHQIAEKLNALARDLRQLGTDIRDVRATVSQTSTWQREVSAYLHDMASLLAGEMRGSDAALAKAEELRACSEILAEWASRPTDQSGNIARAGQLSDIATALVAFAGRIV